MVIAYMDDLIAVGPQEQLDGMKASFDALYTMKTSRSIPAEYPLWQKDLQLRRSPDRTHLYLRRFTRSRWHD